MDSREDLRVLQSNVCPYHTPSLSHDTSIKWLSQLPTHALPYALEAPERLLSNTCNALLWTFLFISASSPDCEVATLSYLSLKPQYLAFCQVLPGEYSISTQWMNKWVLYPTLPLKILSPPSQMMHRIIILDVMIWHVLLVAVRLIQGQCLWGE